MSTDPLLNVKQIKGTVMLNDLQGAGPQVYYLINIIASIYILDQFVFTRQSIIRIPL